MCICVDNKTMRVFERLYERLCLAKPEYIFQSCHVQNMSKKVREDFKNVSLVSSFDTRHFHRFGTRDMFSMTYFSGLVKMDLKIIPSGNKALGSKYHTFFSIVDRLFIKYNNLHLFGPILNSQFIV